MYRPSNPVLAVLGLSIFAFAVLGSNATQAQSATNALPEFPGDAVVRYVPENSLPGTSVGEPVAATDDDNDPLTYSITGADADLFVIEGVTGQIQVGEGTALDYEFKTSYAVTVTAVDPSGANASVAVTIRVGDMTLDTPYDHDNNEIIDRDEAIAAVADYFSGVISRDEVLRVIQLYFSPTPVPALPRYLAVSSGSKHTCALLHDGAPVCWGSNLFGQSTPPENEQFMAVSSSSRYTCALRLDGTPICWGFEGDDLSLSFGFDYGALVSPPEDERFMTISSGSFHACGLRRNGTVVCWGTDDFENWGQPPEEERFTAISVGDSYTCAIRTDGKVACWGQYVDYRTMALPPTVERVDAVSSGDDYTCGVLDDSSIHCWKPAFWSVSRRGQDDPPKEGKFKAISMADGYGCALRLDGSPVCWGLGQYGGADEGRSWSDDFGQHMPPSETFSDISAGRLHACGLREDGALVCWGIDAHNVEDGQYTTITSGTDRACGIGLQGSAKCWGPKEEPIEPVKITSISNGDDSYSTRTYGLREDGSFVRLDVFRGHFFGPPQDPPESHKFKAIAGGGDYICGVRYDHTAYCWPDDSYDERWQLAEGGFIGVSPAFGTGVHVCGLREDGTAVCQMLNDSVRWDIGQASPPEGKVFTAISSGGFHTCALDVVGRVFCWGSISGVRSSPPEGERFIAVSSGRSHTCVLRKDGVPLCRGDNRFNATSPPEGEKFVSISSGGSHTCGLRQDGTVACWGWEDFGQARPPLQTTVQPSSVP